MIQKYFEAITKFIDDWDEYFQSYDIKSNLYEEDENFIKMFDLNTSMLFLMTHEKTFF